MGRLDCVYTAGLTVRDRSLLATLSLVYDSIRLPHPYDLDPDAAPLVRWPGKYRDDLEHEQRRYLDWIEAHRELIRGGVLSVLPPPLPADAAEPPDLGERLQAELGVEIPYFTRSMVFSGELAIAMHALFAQSDGVDFTLGDPSGRSFDRLRGALVTSLFAFQVPRVSALEAEQILEVREAVEPYRKGFLNEMSKLVGKVEGRVRDGELDMDEAALFELRGRFLPDYEEFLERELPAKIGWWGGTIARTGEFANAVLKTVLTPWTWLNLGNVFSKGGGLLERLAENEVQRRSNRHRAFQFVGSIQRKAPPSAR